MTPARACSRPQSLPRALGSAAGRPSGRGARAVQVAASAPRDRQESNIVNSPQLVRELAPANRGPRTSGASLKAELQRQARLALEAEDSWWSADDARPANMVAPASPSQFKQLVVGAGEGRLVVVDYFKPSCNGCRTLYPKLKQVAANNPEALFVKVNTDAPAFRELSQGMGVASLPWFQLFRDGALLSSFTANVASIGVLRAEVAARKACDSPGCDN